MLGRANKLLLQRRDHRGIYINTGMKTAENS